MISKKKLKEILHYDLETGIFVWIESKQGRRLNCVAGSLNLGYLSIYIEGKSYRGHKLAWFYVYGRWPKELDHINHDRSDNRIANLRKVTRQENCRNRSLSSANTSGVCGVHWYKATKKWRATINLSGRYIHLGCFTSKAAAVKARKDAEVKHGFHPNHGATNE